VRAYKGFTLIELLVVVAVIAVLLAILFPAMRRARAVAKRIGCQSNLRQIAFAWHIYLDDHDGRFLQGRYAHLEYGGWKGTRNPGVEPHPRPLNTYVALPPIVENESGAEVFCCPGDRGGVPGYAVREKAYRFQGTSYQTNIMLIGPDQVLPRAAVFEPLHEEINKRLQHLTVNSVDNPSRLLLIGDTGWINQWKPIPHPDEEWKELAEWHGRVDCHNLAFLDGHAGLLCIEKGIYVADEYTILPFEELYGMARELQEQ
jgi:prepilin-type N-terminal cleavage/methylation domain-containing protein